MFLQNTIYWALWTVKFTIIILKLNISIIDTWLWSDNGVRKGMETEYG